MNTPPSDMNSCAWRACATARAAWDPTTRAPHPQHLDEPGDAVGPEHHVGPNNDVKFGACGGVVCGYTRGTHAPRTPTCRGQGCVRLPVAPQQRRNTTAPVPISRRVLFQQSYHLIATVGQKHLYARLMHWCPP